MPILDQSKSVLVFLANGTQGSAVVFALRRRGIKVRALVRDRTRAAILRTRGVELAEGDLDDLKSLRAASYGVDHAVLQVPTASVEIMSAQANNALSALIAERVSSIVLKLASASRLMPCEEPSFVGNAMIEDAVRRSGLPFAIVRPTMYLDNLLKPSARADIIERGVFAPPIPATQCIAWTSADDCAEAAITLLENGVYGGDYRIAGPESLTGDQLAKRIASGIDRPVAYRAQSIIEFEREVDAAMGVGVGLRVASKFRYFAKYPDEAEEILARPFEARTGLENFRPTDAQTWARRYRSALTGEA